VVRNFMQLLRRKWDEGKFVCVGLDSDAGKLPVVHLGLRDEDDYLLAAQQAYLHSQETGEELGIYHRVPLVDAVMSFNERIVDATKSLVCAYKPNSAFYEALGGDGLRALESTIRYIRHEAPGVPVILDIKRGDIGNTNRGYVRAAALADAMTVHPYLGQEAMQPFLDQENKGVFVLCRTSNPGAGEFQDLKVHLGRWHGDSGEAVYGPLYQYVASRVAGPWNKNGNCGVVVGATYPEELAEVRRIVGEDMPILIPGIGKQGGDLDKAVRAGANSKSQGMVINNSSAVLFASDGPGFAEAAAASAQKMHDDINAVLATA
jgi:orotidine-5'-phosphate decarboxylase